MNKFLSKRSFLYQNSSTKQNYIDSNFLTTNSILQKSFIGDSVWFNKNGLSYMAHQARVSYDKAGLIVRYPDNFGKLAGTDSAESQRYNDHRTVSRDNSMGYLMMCGYFGHHSIVRSFMWRTIKRLSFFQNTHTVKGERKLLPDLCGLSQWTILLRCGFPKWGLFLLFPLLAVLDVFYLLQYAWHVVQSWFNPSHTSTVFHMLSGVITCRNTIQTPFSWLAEKLFLNMRRKVKGFDYDNGVVSALAYYSRKEYDPPIHELAEKVVNKLKE